MRFINERLIKGTVTEFWGGVGAGGGSVSISYKDWHFCDKMEMFHTQFKVFHVTI